jgi:hypothetical protein
MIKLSRGGVRAKPSDKGGLQLKVSVLQTLWLSPTENRYRVCAAAAQALRRRRFGEANPLGGRLFDAIGVQPSEQLLKSVVLIKNLSLLFKNRNYDKPMIQMWDETGVSYFFTASESTD